MTGRGGGGAFAEPLAVFPSMEKPPLHRFFATTSKEKTSMFARKSRSFREHPTTARPAYFAIPDDGTRSYGLVARGTARDRGGSDDGQGSDILRYAMDGYFKACFAQNAVQQRFHTT